MHGKREEIRLVLAALACGGHVLFEDVPGTAKTVLARAIAGSIEGATTSRIQCTPDLQPTDVTGPRGLRPARRASSSSGPGPIFANVVLVDEINRAMPKTQSALLEAMAERQVTVDGDDAAAARRRSSCSRPRTRSSRRGRSRCPRRSSTASSSRPRSATRGEEDEILILRGAGRRASAGAPRDRADARRGRRAPRGRRRASTSIPCSGAGSSSSFARPGRSRASTIGASVRGSLALERAARAWALLERARVRHPGRRRAAVPARRRAPDRLHPGLRRRGARAAAGRRRWSRFREQCLELAPRPGDDARRATSPPRRPLVPQPQLTFPLDPARRLVGLAFGAMHSARRGTGSDVAGSRPYRPRRRRHGDRLARVRPALAARGMDEFVVREHFADEAPRVVVLCDRRPSMSLYPPGWPWLEKPRGDRGAGCADRRQRSRRRRATSAISTTAVGRAAVAAAAQRASGAPRARVRAAVPRAGGRARARARAS